MKKHNIDGKIMKIGFKVSTPIGRDIFLTKNQITTLFFLKFVFYVKTNVSDKKKSDTLQVAGSFGRRERIAKLHS